MDPIVAIFRRFFPLFLEAGTLLFIFDFSFSKDSKMTCVLRRNLLSLARPWTLYWQRARIQNWYNSLTLHNVMKEDLGFDGPDWLMLETAIETIGDMIAHHCARLNKALQLDPPDIALVEEIRYEIKRLNTELLLCYTKDKCREVIIKAYTAYGSQLRMIKHNRSSIT